MLLLVGSLLLFPPLFVLGPLAGLLAASRPRSLREWWWIGAAVLWIVLTALHPGNLSDQVRYAWALCVTGMFVLLMLGRNLSLVTGSLLATGLTGLLLTFWLKQLHLDWSTVELAIRHDVTASWRAYQAAAGGEDLSNSTEVSAGVQQMIDGLSRVTPAILALMVLPGLAVAWSWYRRLAGTPIGAPSQRFAEFRFSDLLIWGVVLGGVALTFPPPEPFDRIAENLAMVMAVLYTARGAAVMWSRVERWPGPLLALLALASMFVLPVLLGAAFALGVADTWVDFRRPRALIDQTRE
ncbi:MAG TPA: DUF2232 domain-containing protein [Gemmatimonadales bacterium]|nr:DUF2232 domain-containing protein [Gemmatimonadales bacterium]